MSHWPVRRFHMQEAALLTKSAEAAPYWRWIFFHLKTQGDDERTCTGKRPIHTSHVVSANLKSDAHAQHTAAREDYGAAFKHTPPSFGRTKVSVFR